MSMRAIFRFENLDSTKDLNDRFSGLFRKGVYKGGEVERPANSSGYVVVKPFCAMSADGMAVISDEDIIVPVGAGTYYIVLNARYNIGSEPTIEMQAVSKQSVDELPDTDTKKSSLVKFAFVNNSVIDTKSEDSRDVIDPVGRNHYKGVYSSESMPSESNLSKGDWFFVQQGNSSVYFIEMYTADGSNPYVSFKPVTDIENSLGDHRLNTINVTGQDSTLKNQGYWHIPCVEDNNNASTVMDETRAESDDFGSYHISVNKWFATESLDKDWSYSEIQGSTDKKWDYTTRIWSNYKLTQFSTDLGIDKAREYIVDANFPASFSMKPTNDNRFITQSYPTLPTVNEKIALSGNLRYIDTNTGAAYGDIVGAGNKFVTQRTAGFKLKSANILGDEQKVDGYYYYPINGESRLYIGSNAQPAYYLKYIRYKIDGVNEDMSLPHNLDKFVICYKNTSTNEYTSISTSDLDTGTGDSWNRCSNRGFLKLLPTEYSGYYLKSPVKLTSIDFYTVENFDKTEAAPIINDYTQPFMDVTQLKAKYLYCTDGASFDAGFTANGPVTINDSITISGNATFNYGLNIAEGQFIRFTNSRYQGILEFDAVHLRLLFRMLDTSATPVDVATYTVFLVNEGNYT